MADVAGAAPLLAGEAARRAEAALAAKRPPVPIDLATARAEFVAMMADAWQPAKGYA